MASSTRTQVEQDMSRHTLGHIFAKLNGLRRSRTTFVVVEGADDLAFYRRFFDLRRVAAYYSTKEDDSGKVQNGGCEELQHIVNTVLADGRTEQVVGIMDTDYRRFHRGYRYPRHIFHTDHRDMEMTALGTSSVQQALQGWIADYDEVMDSIEPVLRHAGKLRIVNDLYRLGCNFKRKVKVSSIFDELTHRVYIDWKKRYDKLFRHSCLNKRKQTAWGRIKTQAGLYKAWLHLKCNPYSGESRYDVCQGHDTIALLSLSLVNTAVYSEGNIWEKCFDAYTITDFKNTQLFASLHDWESTRGLNLFKKG